MSKSLLALLGIGMLGTAVGLAALAKDKENKKDDEQEDARPIALDKIPAAARDALKKLAAPAKIEEVTLEDEDGVKVYEASWEVDGVEHEAEVTEQGDVIEIEEVIALDAAPQAVQKAAAKAFPKSAKVKIEKKTIVLYEIESNVQGKEHEILVAPTGQRIEIEHEDDEDDERDDD